MPLRPTEPDPEDFVPDPMPPDILAEIGRLVTRWGYLESTVEMLMAGFLGTDPVYLFPITSDLQIRTRLSHLRSISRLRLSAEHFQILNNVIAQIEGLCSFRNLVVHGLWNALDAPEPGVVMLIEARIQKKTSVHRQITQYCNLDYLEWLVAATNHATYLLHDFGLQFGLLPQNA